MRIRTIHIGLLFLAFGCVNSPKETTDDKSIDKKIDYEKLENTLVYNSNDAIWAYDFDSILKDFRPIKLRKIINDTLTAEEIERIVNRTWPKIQIKYVKSKNDTVFVVIPESEVLTQQMGTTGADQFMISTTYSFTELIGIKYVSYDFEFGDHANPGVYDRQSWDEK